MNINGGDESGDENNVQKTGNGERRRLTAEGTEEE